MNCGQFETRLNLLLDQRRSPAADSALAVHAAVCADCDELLADHVVLVACASQRRAPKMSAGFAERVVAAAGPMVVRPRRTKRLFLAACVALSSAAAMLLAISIVWKARQAGPTSGGQAVAKQGMNSADFLLGSPYMWSNELAMAGSSLKFDEVDRIAPAFRPLRESIAMIWDALRRAWNTPHGSDTQPAEKRTGQWAAISPSLA